ncbi:MAG: thioredoxin family protein [Actinobacteria bacterium]|nr:thioredoxin family protein [Actinomycetota bacterium]
MAEELKLSVYGSGCKNCHTLHENAKQAVTGLGIDAEVSYITDIIEIANKGIMKTPALTIGGKLVSSGKVLSEKEIVALIEKNRA